MTSIVEQFVSNQRELAQSRGRRFRIRKPPIVQPPDGAERAYRGYLLDVVADMRDAIVELVFPILPGLVRESQGRLDARFNLADLEETLRTIFGDVQLRVDNRSLRGLEQKLVEYRAATSQHSLRNLRRQIRQMIALDAFPRAGTAEETMLKSWVEANRKRIKSMVNEEIEKVEDIVRRNTQAGVRANRIKELVGEQWPKVQSRAALIARDQVNKLHGNLTRVRQTSLGIEQYIWRTSRDERVRESHLVKEGKVFSWDDPPADTGHPGQDIQCRCTAEPFLEGETRPSAAERNAVVAEVRMRRKELAGFRDLSRAEQRQRLAEITAARQRRRGVQGG